MLRASPCIRQESTSTITAPTMLYYTQVLNPNAWAPCPTNSACCGLRAVLYKDFRGPRIPSENANIGRHFRVGKEGKYDFYIRGEFVNIFNRTLFATPAGFTIKSAERTGERRRRRHHIIPAGLEPSATLTLRRTQRMRILAGRERSSRASNSKGIRAYFRKG